MEEKKNFRLSKTRKIGEQFDFPFRTKNLIYSMEIFYGDTIEISIAVGSINVLYNILSNWVLPQPNKGIEDLKTDTTTKNISWEKLFCYIDPENISDKEIEVFFKKLISHLDELEDFIKQAYDDMYAKQQDDDDDDSDDYDYDEDEDN